MTNPESCEGDRDFHDIACGEPGISTPGGNREVPEDLNEPGQRWCTACLDTAKQTPERADR